MFCTNCGASNKGDSKFCINCAESLTEVQITKKLSRTRVLKNVSSFKKVDFFQTLFDFSFSKFISPKIVKFLYGLSILFAALLAVFFIVVGFEASMWFGIFALFIGAPLILLLTVISSRVFLETTLVIFRIADCVENMRSVDREKNPESRDGIEWNV